MTPAYQLNEVAFSYGPDPLLYLNNVEVSAGERIALVGPNGAGKTTLLHLLAFLETQDSGTISFFGKTAGKDNLIPFRRRVGLLLQHPYLFNTTVMSNLTSGLKVRGVARSKRRKMAVSALEWVGLSGFGGRSARSLSGGEAQRVALARALVLDPEVLLLDEPANHMDISSVQRIEEIVLEMNREKGTTVVFTTHQIGGNRFLSPHRVFSISRKELTAPAQLILIPGIKS